MKIAIQLTSKPIDISRLREEFRGRAGAVVEFDGVVRDAENGQTISALEYEAYSPMAENQMRHILETLGEKFPCLAAHVVHRIGVIPVGETAIYVGIVAKHRGEAFAMLSAFMDRLKQDVPIWKVRAISVKSEVGSLKFEGTKSAIKSSSSGWRLEEALAEISSRCRPLPGVRTPLAEALDRVLREPVIAADDLPATDKSTRDGYAILEHDSSATFQVIDTIHAADWKPRQLKTGEAVRIATGGSLPGDGLRVVMQEHVEREGDRIRVVRRENALNIRKRGAEVRAGQTVVAAGNGLTAGALAMLATVGCTQPLVSPRLRIAHFTTGDEIVSPDQKPAPGQIRDSNSILMRALLRSFPCELTQVHLREDFEQAKVEIGDRRSEIGGVDVVLISGGASVGEKDFTRPLLEWLDFEIVFNRVNIRPGAPLIFGWADDGRRVAFGLPGNPLSHFVCYQLFVTTALRRLTGAAVRGFLRGRLASKLEDASNPRETLWPARAELDEAGWSLTPLPWSSSGDVNCLVAANALLRVPASAQNLDAGIAVEFIPTDRT